MQGSPRRILIIHNPVAGRRRPGLLASVTAVVEREGLAIDLRATSGPEDAETFARAARAEEHAVLVASGGDGTINGVVNGLMRAGHPVPPLALLPLGTTNVLAREIGLPTSADAIAQTVLHGRPRAIWPGRANGRYFILMAGAGFDAVVVDRTRLWLKRLIGKGAYVAEALWQSARYPYPPFTVEIDGQRFAARTVVACKGRFYGGSHVLAPAADLSDPSLEVCLLERGGPLAQVRYGLALATGRLSRLPDVTIVRGREVQVTCAEEGPVQCDGDSACTLPLTVTVADQPLQMLVPARA